MRNELVFRIARILAVAILGAMAGGSAMAAEPSPGATSQPAHWRLVVIGDSIATTSDDGPTYVDRYAEAITRDTGIPVDVDNRATVQLSNLPAMQATQLRNAILTDASLREAIAGADIVLVNVGHNDTPWNRLDNPCDVSDPSATDVQWSRIDEACVSRVLGDYKGTLDEIFTQIDTLRGCWTPLGETSSCASRGGRDTMLRLTTVFNDWVGWSGGSDEATLVTARVNDAYAAAQCWVVRMHGGECADVLHVLNGPDGTADAGAYLRGDHEAHLNALGHQTVADLLANLGYGPLG